MFSNKKYIVILLLLFFSVNLLKSQNIDSLTNLLKTSDASEKIDVYFLISKYYLDENSDLSKIYAQKALSLSKNKDFQLKITDSYILISNCYLKSNQLDTAMMYADSAYYVISKTENTKKNAEIFFQQALIYYLSENYEKAESLFLNSLIIHKENKDTLLLIPIYRRLGMTNYMKSNYAKAIEYFMKGLVLAEQSGYREAIASSKNNIAMTYATDKDFENSLIYYKEALNTYTELGDLNGVAIVFNNIGDVYTDMDLLDSALNNFQKSLEIFLQNEDVFSIAICRTNIAEIYIQINKLTEAKELLNQASEVFEEYQMQYYLAAVYHLYGKLYLNDNDFFNAEKNFFTSLELSVKSNSKDMEKENYSFLSELFYVEEEYQQAYIYHKKYTDLKDSLYNIENSVKINQLKINYETEKKDKELQLNQLEINKQKKLLFFFEIAFAIFVLLITLAIVFYKKLNDSYKKLVEVNIELAESPIIPAETELNDAEIVESIQTETNEVDEVKNNFLREEQIIELRKGIEQLIEEKIYLKTDLSLDKMSKILNTNKLYLSKFINLEYKKNFNTFINIFRIKEAQKLIISPAYKNYSFDGIAHSVGFKSRSSFYSTFKKVTGVTPSFYKKQSK